MKASNTLIVDIYLQVKHVENIFIYHSWKKSSYRKTIFSSSWRAINVLQG